MMKKLNRFAALLLALLLLIPTAVADGIDFSGMPACYRYLTAGDAAVSVPYHINVYAQPNINASVIGQARSGSTVEVVMMNAQGWAFIRTPAVPEGGWVQSGMLINQSYLNYNGILVGSGEGRRINLRAEPSANTDVLAKYYSGTLVEILDETPVYEGQVSYYLVRIGNDVNAEGWVDSRRLRFAVSSDRVEMPSIMVHGSVSTQSPIYKTPYYTYQSAEYVTFVTNSSYVTVLGIRKDGMYHVMYQGQTGYMSEKDLREKLPWDLAPADTVTGPTQILLDASYDSLYVLSSKKDSRVNLRNKPYSDATMICQYYTGTPVTIIGEPENGFQHIRIGRVEGYMMENFLVDTPYERESDLKLYEVVAAEGYTLVRKWNTEESEVIGVLYNSTKVVVIGRDGKWAHIVYDEEEQNYGFVLYDDLYEVPVY